MNPAANGHLEHWLNKPETAARLGISERTLDRLAASGHGPERRLRRRPGRRPEPVYNPDDVATLAAAVPAVLPATQALAPVPPGAVPYGLQTALELIDRLAAFAARPSPPPAPPALWLTLAEASAYSGLSVRLLRRLVRDGRLPALRDRAFKIRRADLDSLASLSPMAAAGGPAC